MGIAIGQILPLAVGVALCPVPIIAVTLMLMSQRPRLNGPVFVVAFGRRTVIDHLSLDVRRGEILGLVGASGGGKSVLMRTIIGLIPRQGGEIEVMGAAIGQILPLAVGVALSPVPITRSC